MMEITQNELDGITKTTERLRPKALDDQKSIKEINVKEKLVLFIHSFDFISSIKNTINNQGLKTKFEKVRDKFKEIYSKGLNLINLSNRELWSEWRVTKKIEVLVMKEREGIEELIDFTRFLGKKVKLYNPDEHAGIKEDFGSGT